MHCHVVPTLAQLETQYGDKVQRVLRDAPLDPRHPGARQAHEAARCAHAQGKCWAAKAVPFGSDSCFTLQVLLCPWPPESKNLTRDFLNQRGQVGLFKTDARRWHAVVLDVGWDMLVVWIGTGQCGDMGMFEPVRPGNFLTSLIDFVAVAAYASSLKVNEFPDIESHVTCARHLSLKLRQRRAK